VFDIQDAISSEVARELRLELRSQEETRSTGPPTEDSEAYLLYLKGRFYWNQRTPASLETALRYFNEALERDPRFALAHVGIADAYHVLEANQRIAPAEALDRVQKAVTRALEIDDTLAEAHASRAVLMEREWNWEEAEREFRRALKLKPGEVRILCWYAQLLAEMGRHDEALTQIRRALDLDPLSSYVKVVHGLLLYLARRYDEAQRQLAFTMDLDPDDEAVHDQLAYVYAQKGMFEEALAAASRASTLRGDATTSVVLGYTSAVAGRRDSALAIVRRLIEQWERRQGSPAGIGVIYAALGDRDAALRWLETAYSEHDSWVTFLKVDAVFDTLRADARFTALLEKTALAEAAAASGRRPL
jgi:tetratricopeptide (TPR) repeat protein